MVYIICSVRTSFFGKFRHAVILDYHMAFVVLIMLSSILTWCNCCDQYDIFVI